MAAGKDQPFDVAVRSQQRQAILGLRPQPAPMVQNARVGQHRHEFQRQTQQPLHPARRHALVVANRLARRAHHNPPIGARHHVPVPSAGMPTRQRRVELALAGVQQQQLAMQRLDRRPARRKPRHQVRPCARRDDHRVRVQMLLVGLDARHALRRHRHALHGPPAQDLRARPRRRHRQCLGQERRLDLSVVRQEQGAQNRRSQRRLQLARRLRIQPLGAQPLRLHPPRALLPRCHFLRRRAHFQQTVLQQVHRHAARRLQFIGKARP